MEELSNIAMAHYQAGSDHLQKLARDFFGAMDHDGDGKIDQREFLEFMKEEGYGQMTNPSFFKQLDLDGNGTLDFVEVMTLYYIVKSRRPFCDNCKRFIVSTYFMCVGCLEDPLGGAFYLCLDCYVGQKCDHTHNGLSRFLDNYSLLEAKIKSDASQPTFSESKSKPSTTTVSVQDKSPLLNHHHHHVWNPSSAMVPVPNTYHLHQHPPWHASAAPPLPNPSSAMVPVPNTYHHQHPPWHASAAPPLPLAYHHHMYVQNNFAIHHHPPNLAPQPNAIVPQRERWKIALGALNAAVQIGAIGSNFCSIL